MKTANNLDLISAFLFYYERGFNVIPVTRNKEAITKEWSRYTWIRVPEEMVHEWIEKIKKEKLNIAIVTKWDNLVVYDCDSEEVYQKYKEAFKKVFEKYPEEVTWVVKTGKGYHVYLKIEEVNRLKTNKIILTIEKDGKKVELRRQFGGYVVAPPSIHPSGKKYIWVHNDNVQEILKVPEEKIIELESCLNPFLWKRQAAQGVKSDVERELTEKEIEKIITWLKESKLWIPGQRQLVLLALSYILRIFGKIKLDSVIHLYEKIKEALGDDPKDYSQRISGIRLTFEKEASEVGYRPWLEELGWAENQIEEFKFNILKIINKNIKTLFSRGLSWVYEVSRDYLKPITNDEGEVVSYYQRIQFKLLTVKNGKVIDRTAYVGRKYDAESMIVTEERIEEKSKTKFLTSKKIEYIKGAITPKGTYVRLAILDESGRYVVEGLLEDVLEQLHKVYRILTKDGKEKFGQLLSFLAKFEEKTYSYPGIILDGENFVATVPGSEAIEYLFPETESQARWIRKIKEDMKYVKEEDFIEYLKAWIKYKEFLPDYVYFIVLGYTFIAPFFHALVSITDLKPGLYLIGPKKSGKTTLGKFIAVLGYGSKTLARTALESGFRFDELFSTATIPILIDDIERVNPSIVSRLKALLTGDVEAFRGTGSLKLKDYKLIAVPIITANHDALGLSSDPALLDRLIVLTFDWRIPREKVNEFRRTIGKIFIGRKTFAPYLIKTLVEVANNLGGIRFFKAEFDRVFEELINSIEDEGRTIEKATLIILGLRLANEVFKRLLGITFDLEEAKKKVIEHFTRPIDVSEFAPEELINLAAIILEPPEDIEIPIKELEGKKYFIITQDLLIRINQKYKVKLPRKLADLKRMLLSLFRDLEPGEIYKPVRLDTGNVKKAVLIKEAIVYKLLGREEEYDILKKSIEKYNAKETKSTGIEICAICGQRIGEGERIIVHDGKYYHEKCWKLRVASEIMNNSPEKEIIGEPREVDESELDF